MGSIPDRFNWLRKFTPGGDTGLACGVLLLLSILILPMPTILLDLVLTIAEARHRVTPNKELIRGVLV